MTPFYKMDEDSSEVHQRMRNKTSDALVFAVTMLIVAIVMGILYATKKAPDCNADYKCLKLVEKLERIVEALNSELMVCLNQDENHTII
jgi:flagellin-specific chaperone FliS